MSDNKDDNPIEAVVASDGGLSVEVGGENAEITNTVGASGSLEFSKDQQQQDGDKPAEEKKADEQKPEGDKPAEEKKADEPASDAALAAEDLGEYKDEDAEKWVAAYKTKEGTLDTARLTAEWYKNKSAEGDASGKLNEGTYKFLEKQGLSRADVDAIGLALEAQSRTIQTGLVERAGGQEGLDAALAWGRAGGYTKTQLDRFNSAMSSNNLEQMQEAIDLLTARYSKANPKAEAPTRPKETRGAAVPRTVPESTEKYATMDEQIEASKKVKQIKDPVARQRAWVKHLSKIRGEA